MSVASQVFALFYAVLYGVLFTISDRWRPFATALRGREGLCRVALSAGFFGVLPVGYFVWAFASLLPVNRVDSVALATAAYLVAPLGAFYFSWMWIVLSWRDTFYSRHERTLEPLKTSLEWFGSMPVSWFAIIVLLIAFLVGPIIALRLLGRQHG